MLLIVVSVAWLSFEWWALSFVVGCVGSSLVLLMMATLLQFCRVASSCFSLGLHCLKFGVLDVGFIGSTLNSCKCVCIHACIGTSLELCMTASTWNHGQACFS